MTYPILGGVSINGETVAGACHAGHRVGLTHGGIMLLPSGKNLMRYGACDAAPLTVTVNTDGGLHCVFGEGVKAWNYVSFKTPLTDAGLSVGDHITVSTDSAELDGLNGQIHVSIRFLASTGTFISQLDTLGANTTVVSGVIPDGTAVIETQVYTSADVSEDMVFDVHLQLEAGGARTAWEPPAVMAAGGGGSLSLIGAWNPSSGWDLDKTIDGPTLRIKRDETTTSWSSVSTMPVDLPAGSYRIQVLGSLTNLACELHKDDDPIVYIGNDWTAFTLTDTTSVKVVIACSPKWHGDVELRVILLAVS